MLKRNLLVYLASFLVLTLIPKAAMASGFVPGEFFVRWRTDSPQIQGQVLDSTGAQIVELSRSELVPGLVRYHTNNTSIVSMLDQLARNPAVKYAELNFTQTRHIAKPQAISSRPGFMKIFGSNDGLGVEIVPQDPSFSLQWALNTPKGINISDAWKITKGSKDILVAVIDTGADLEHEDLKGQFVAGYDFIDKTDVIKDGHGHGTHVSGVIGALHNTIGIAGINAEVSIMPLRAVPSDGDETDDNVAAAFEYAANHGVRVANCSFGKEASSQAVGDTIEAAGQKGLLAVVAAGNDGQDNNKASAFPANFRTSNMIVVAASGRNGNLASFSNYGLGKVDIAAPGVSILSTIPGNQYASWAGTSMATPQVVGVAALVLSAKPSLSVAELKQALLSTARVEPALQTKIVTGGIVDATAAVKAVAQ